MSTQKTIPTVRSLRADALRALLALHHQPPASVLELAELLDAGADACARATGGAPCSPCDVKREAAALLRSVAALRELTDADLTARPDDQGDGTN